MDEHQRPNGIPVTHFTLQSIYAQGDDEKLEFEYESSNTNILVRWSICSRYVFFFFSFWELYLKFILNKIYEEIYIFDSSGE